MVLRLPTNGESLALEKNQNRPPPLGTPRLGRDHHRPTNPAPKIPRLWTR
jgi:hypothetical protein